METGPADASAAARWRQRAEALCAASVRALAGDPALHFRGHRLYRGDHRLPYFAAHLYPAPDEPYAAWRGAADDLALRVRHSDTALHVQLMPDERVARALFEAFEQIRVESLAPPDLPGVARNVRARHAQWSLAFHHAGHTASEAGILVYTVLEVVRARVARAPVLAETEDLIEATRAAIVPALGADLVAMAHQRADQAAYAVPARALARTVAEWLATRTAGDTAGAPTDAATPPEAARNVFGLIIESDGDDEPRFGTAVSGRSPMLDAADGGYHVYTTAYDREQRVVALARPAELHALRAQLELQIAAQGANRGQLARALRTLLAPEAPAGWASHLEEGLIDGRRLAPMIASPADRHVFRQHHHEPTADSVVGLLLDCSGSMKAHAGRLAVLVDVLARALSELGVASEVLGYTTGAWNGGRAERDWRRAGCPAHPGRLNERLHLVFKDADTSWRRAREGIAALLKPDLFREGIDGEAVDWAVTRLMARDEARKLLFVFSDGSPMDSATERANDPHYLGQHLADVLARHERAGGCRVFGVGVGLDLTPYYRRSRILDTKDLTGNGLFRDMLALLATRGSR